jgi:hypothetical protein
VTDQPTIDLTHAVQPAGVVPAKPRRNYQGPGALASPIFYATCVVCALGVAGLLAVVLLT